MFAIKVDKVSKSFRIKRRYKQATTLKSALINLLKRQRVAQKEREFWALQGVSFEVPKGTTLGIIGSNGSGKSTLLKLIAGIHRPTSGGVRTEGRISALIELGAGFHPEFTGRENIYINGIILGLSRRQIQQKIDDIIRFSELEEFIDNPVKTYSSGMYMRLAFAIAVAVDPEILLIDEILAVGDASFQRKCQNKINTFKADGKTIVIVTHDLAALERHCDRVLWLDHGKLQAYGDVQSVMQMYMENVAQRQRENLLDEHLHDGDGGEGAQQSLRKKRWGSREVEIQAVELYNGSRDPCYLYKTGDKMTIELVYKAYRPIYEPVFGIGIFRDDDTFCYGTNTHLEKIPIPRIEGEGKVKFCIDRLDLTEGKYLLDVAVHTKEGFPFDYQTRSYSFDVMSLIKDVGVYRPLHRWEFE
ncbi:ATP-binding cassette domain-containing protein [candidate division KSB3 bacterium]|uniref:ATP-binding cassette domain-containing protein n=1 Tax=candidate division KSB3 bacterium TaxID=2044937 RepID=A0A9D5JXV3_9BACT|nr:ATP-binding cassette domain-containing protein [candidate division KSB3 bacterium]MBD3326125.1 ATP-binding cassette domain-containing protein [candidate division KSB3 bacterium]